MHAGVVRRCVLYTYAVVALGCMGKGKVLFCAPHQKDFLLQKGEGKVRQTDGTSWVVSGYFTPRGRGILLAYMIQSCAESTGSWRYLGLLENLLTQKHHNVGFNLSL